MIEVGVEIAVENDVGIDGLVGLNDGCEVLDVGPIFGGGVSDESLIGTGDDTEANFVIGNAVHFGGIEIEGESSGMFVELFIF